MNVHVDAPVLNAPFFVRGKLLEGNEVRLKSRDLGADFTTPAINLDHIITPRSEMPPMADMKIAEIIDFMHGFGEKLNIKTNVYLQECLDRLVATSPLPRRVVEDMFVGLPYYVNRDMLWASVRGNFPNPDHLDGWVESTDPYGKKLRLRAFPPRMVHMMAGNAPTGCLASIVQGALVKAVNLFKMSSSDPFTCVAILRTMQEYAPDHAVTRSMSAIYWRGGDESIERMLYRPQYFDRIAAWGGGPAINNVIKYLGPGIQLVSFDPKASISMLGVESFANDDVIAQCADNAAEDVMVLNQDACVASRFIYAEDGNPAGLEKFCAKLHEALGVDRSTGSAITPLPPTDIREEIEVLQAMGDDFQVWGKFDGRGVVILTDRPVDFHPIGKVVNVVKTPSLGDAVRYVNVATQTIGVYPPERRAEIRDRVANAGGQRLCHLGSAFKHALGGPQDGMFPLARFVHWMKEDDA